MFFFVTESNEHGNLTEMGIVMLCIYVLERQINTKVIHEDNDDDKEKKATDLKCFFMRKCHSNDDQIRLIRFSNFSTATNVISKKKVISMLMLQQ